MVLYVLFRVCVLKLLKHDTVFVSYLEIKHYNLLAINQQDKELTY